MFAILLDVLLLQIQEKNPSLCWLQGGVVGDGPNTFSESMVLSTELSEFFCPHRVAGRELSEFLSTYYLCAKMNSPSLSQNSPNLPKNSVSSLFRHSALENNIPPVSYVEGAPKSMESQTRSSKRALWELQSWRVQGTLCQPFANPVPTLCQPFASSLPTFSANPPPSSSFCGPQSPVLETQVNGFFGKLSTNILRTKISAPQSMRMRKWYAHEKILVEI